jgi:hypothetical protein
MAAMNLGVTLKERGDHANACPLLAENYAVKARVLGAAHVDTCFAALNLIALWVDGSYVARYEEAEALATRTRAALESSFGPEHPSCLSAQVMTTHCRGLPFSAP